ncbi:OmpP1/FadL family transporter [Bradymonas sediminis]|uniref:Uncharacterized protein n=1 Tax=Bradymonas sediminis TaxID=1548548 RepID=A0A2Z4FKR3_9DELT|nr:outer membrane protein transport protein [Bradymonas sediminis]AWV89420.1 hypothetical protein DN745_08745 [Bradymonas sediminis]TDP73602.1 long-subunit fatty acid transport protein [Bradymonas sediminis]
MNQADQSRGYPFHNPLSSRRLRALTGAATALLLTVAGTQSVQAGGFEIPENTTKSVARGGTGVVNKRDPSALYFNPALLPRARGFQALVNVNFVNLNIDFQRDPLIRNAGKRNEQVIEFDPVTNEAGFFPAPFLSLSYDFGIKNFAAGLGLFGPSGYGGRCYGEVKDGECKVRTADPNGVDAAARYMMVNSSMIEVLGSLGAGYTFEVGGGELSIGATGMLTYLDADFILAVHGIPGEEKLEDPSNDAIFYGKSLSDLAMTGTFGVAYDFQGWRAALSYRLPIDWEAEGTVSMTPAPSTGLGELTDDRLTLATAQAGNLRAGIAYEGGVHPGDPELPRYDIEFNMVWEDWSRLEHFKIDPRGQLLLGGAEIDLGTLYQVKNYKDTYSFRLGGSYAINEWLSGHAGGYYETGAQSNEYTNVDFVSWDRFASGLGVTFRLFDMLDLDLAYQHVFSPDRVVKNGKVHQQVPLADCKGPDYDNEYCSPQGTPPGNPQNNGTWSSSFQTASVGLTFYYD